MKFNLNNFTFEDVEASLPADCFLTNKYNQQTKKGTHYEIPDSFDAKITHGSENLYFDITIYFDGFKEREMAIYSKENRAELMKWIMEIFNNLI